MVHINWIDLTQNHFDDDATTNGVIVQGLKKQKEILYAGLSTQKTQTEQFVRLI